MHVLLCNDDGIDALGLSVLARATRAFFDLGDIADSRITVVAPSVEHSGAAHRITIGATLHAVRFPFDHVDDAFSVDGTPCDAVRLALAPGGLLEHLALPPADFVLVGINHGSNIGHDLWYSGTVATAVEAAGSGVPAIALSRQRKWIANAGDHEPFIARLGADLATWWTLAQSRERTLLLSVNYPGHATERMGPTRYTAHAGTYDGERTVAKPDPARPNTLAFKVSRGEGVARHAHVSPWSDQEAVAAGNVSVTPLAPNLTDDALRRELDAGTRAPAAE